MIRLKYSTLPLLASVIVGTAAIATPAQAQTSDYRFRDNAGRSLGTARPDANVGGYRLYDRQGRPQGTARQNPGEDRVRLYDQAGRRVGTVERR